MAPAGQELTNRLRLHIVDDGEGHALVPEVDGQSLIDLVGRHEIAHQYRPSGAYGGIVVARIDDGELVNHFLGIAASHWPRHGEAWLLACDCGELGCWPLEATVTLTPEMVIWSDFRQPFRPSWSYEGLGPFRFNRVQFEAAISEALNALGEEPQA